MCNYQLEDVRIGVSLKTIVSRDGEKLLIYIIGINNETPGKKRISLLLLELGTLSVVILRGRWKQGVYNPDTKKPPVKQQEAPVEPYIHVTIRAASRTIRECLRHHAVSIPRSPSSPHPR